jgi:acetolactate synthase-1/3 small subunit
MALPGPGQNQQDGSQGMNAMNTHYPDPVRVEPVNRHTLAVVVDNEPGVLARISGMFSGRGYNIESLTVSETEEARHLSRITIVTTGTNAVIEQIKAQLDRLVPVHRVVDLTLQGNALEREICLVKVRGEGEHRSEALRLAAAFGAKTLDATLNSFVFELTGATEEIDRFVRLMSVIGLVEICRTGISAMGRGSEPL